MNPGRPLEAHPTSVHDDESSRLREQYSEIAFLAGRLAHEIKNPLSTIRLNMELLAEDFADSVTPRDRRAVKKIALVQRECQRLQDLLDDFLKFTRVRLPKREPQNLNALVERMLEFYAPQAQQAGIEIIKYLDADLPGVLLDHESFEAALLNLILNAQQAMPQGGQLVVRTRVTSRGVALDLIDTGSGIDEATLPRIFEAFYSTKPAGSGLGLPTTLKIVEAHGGALHVQSEVGVGTQMTIELPVPARLSDAAHRAAGGEKTAT